MRFPVDRRRRIAIDMDGAVIDVVAVPLGETGDQRDAALPRYLCQALYDRSVRRFGEIPDRLPRAVAGQAELRRHQQRRFFRSRLRRRPRKAVEIGGDVAAGRLHLERGELHHIPSDDMAPSSFGRSPKRATRPKITAAMVTNSTVTDAMVGV
ncbi:hypothetical protein D3C72_1739730 [compost metagenome]